MKIITVTEDVDLKSELNLSIIFISIILMFVGSIISSIFPQYGILDLPLSVLIGALISIVGNLILLYGQKDKLVKIKRIKLEETITLKDEVKCELKPPKHQSK